MPTPDWLRRRIRGQPPRPRRRPSPGLGPELGVPCPSCGAEAGARCEAVITGLRARNCGGRRAALWTAGPPGEPELPF